MAGLCTVHQYNELLLICIAFLLGRFCHASHTPVLGKWSCIQIFILVYVARHPSCFFCTLSFNVLRNCSHFMGLGLCYWVLTYHALSPRHYLFRCFLKVKQITHLHQKLILTLHLCHDCSKSQAQHTWAWFTKPTGLSVRETCAYRGDLMLVHSRLKISSMWFFFFSFAVGLLSDWKSKNHNAIPENTPSFRPHLPHNLPYLLHLRAFL